jgi:hypothetical protein
VFATRISIFRVQLLCDKFVDKFDKSPLRVINRIESKLPLT